MTLRRTALQLASGQVVQDGDPRAMVAGARTERARQFLSTITH